jgi:hypothetical protein
MSLILYRKPDPSGVRPFAALYVCYFLLTFLTINTYYLVFFEVQYRYILWTFLACGYLVSIYTNMKYRPYLDVLVNLLALVFFTIYFRNIIASPYQFGSVLGQLLAILLVLRSYILFTRDDFFIPLVVSLTIMLLCSIPSYESNFVISLQVYFFALIISLYYQSKAKEHEGSRLRSTDREKLRKILNPRFEARILIVFSLVALLLATSFYLFTPHEQWSKRRYARQLQMYIGSRKQSDHQDGQDGQQNEPLQSNLASSYLGFNQDNFKIAQGGTIRQGPDANDVVLEIQMNYQRRMRAMVWDIYEDGEWKRSGKLNDDYEINQEGENAQDGFTISIPRQITIEDLKMNTIQYDGTVYIIKKSLPSSFLFLPWQTESVNIDIDELYLNKDMEVKLSSYGASKKRFIGLIRGISSYRFSATSYVPSGIEQGYLKQKTYGTFLERYTQLPDSVKKPINGKTVKSFAEEIVRNANAATDYEKTLAISRYLTSVGKYSLDIPYCEPGYDVIAYFLLEVEPKKGHCEIFASSMAVMLRSLNIPCRIVTGYLPGNYAFAKNRYIVQEKNAHAWVEVYFPEIGWIEFDPTPASFWNDTKDSLNNFIAGASNVINELYVYSPEQFYKTRIVPLVRNSVSLYNYNVAKLSERLGGVADIQSIFNMILIIVIIAAILAIVLIFKKPRNRTENYRRLSRIYYQNIIELLTRRGLKIKTGDTPDEMYDKAILKYPVITDPLKKFIETFQALNFAPSYLRSDALTRIKPDYSKTIEKLKKIK